MQHRHMEQAAICERPMTALDVIYGRRSIRSYARRQLERSTIRALLDAAVQAPTAMMEQRWVFAVVQDAHVLRRLSDLVKAALARSAAPPPSLHIKGGAALHAQFVTQITDPHYDVFHGAPTLVIIGARGTEPFVIADCWLAAENLMLAAFALGLGTCCIGVAADTLNTPEGKAEAGIPADVTAVAPIVVGVPEGTPEPATRAEPEIVSWK